ncbi:MAG: HD domain-containing phosphohydrolase [Candidatus Thiodiazotropha sp.]
MISLLPSTRSWFEPYDISVNQQRDIKPLLQSLLVMAWMVEARDPYTGGHLWRVSQYCRLLAESLGLSKSEVARITLGGFLHDLGKIGVSDLILKKPGRLNLEEYEAIQNHLNTICDAFDAMTSTRPYRQNMPPEQALKIIKNNLHTQFDGNFGHIFIDLGYSGRLNTIFGHTDQGIPIQNCLTCGPVIVVTRNQKSGDYLYCPVCHAEAVLERKKREIAIHPSGRKGSVKSIQPKADLDLIGEFVATSAAALALYQT